MPRLLSCVLLLGCLQSAAADDRAIASGLSTLLTRIAPEAVGVDDAWRLMVGGRAVMVLFDVPGGRVRVMAQVTALEALEEGMLETLLSANFERSREARYAVSGTTLWSVYVHPLSGLDERGLLCGLARTVSLAVNFGSSYAAAGDRAQQLEAELLATLPPAAAARGCPG